MTQETGYKDARKFLIVALGIGLLAAGAGLGYYYGIYLPGSNNRIEDEKRQIKEISKIKYQNCIIVANKTFDFDFRLNCNNLYQKNECDLPMNIVNNIENRTDRIRKRCIEEFELGL
jgi:hypothetical protein